jgi:translation initiation factor 2 beta subunit (eIF-2beta)/eIF-5
MTMSTEHPKDFILFSCSVCGTDNCLVKATRSTILKCPSNPKFDGCLWMIKEVIRKVPVCPRCGKVTDNIHDLAYYGCCRECLQRQPPTQSITQTTTSSVEQPQTSSIGLPKTSSIEVPEKYVKPQ